MLEYLRLKNTGPAHEMEIEFASRVNLLTGDNGLGKSFLLDTAWWALTRRWPREVNRNMSCGLPARPIDPARPASIGFRLSARSRNKSVDTTVTYSQRDEEWPLKPGSQWTAGVVVYAHADGSFSVWDPARNLGPRRRPLAYVFTESEVWDGLWTDEDSRSVPVCNGLVRDWSNWIRAQDDNASAMAAALRALSPGAPEEVIRPGELKRISVDDPLDYPSLSTPYAGSVSILHASAGIRRACALAYVLTWAWSEHRIAAKQLGTEVTDRVIMLFDEVESHLHPRWQRSILKALRDFGNEDTQPFAGRVFQLVAATHSPLVLGSTEAWFDPEKDAWFDLDLMNDPPRVCLQRRQYTPRGSAGHWLTSEAFDLATDRGSIEAEQAILRARTLVQQPAPLLDEVMEAHKQLRAVLPDPDVFWVRWNAFVERCGGVP